MFRNSVTQFRTHKWNELPQRSPVPADRSLLDASDQRFCCSISGESSAEEPTLSGVLTIPYTAHCIPRSLSNEEERKKKVLGVILYSLNKYLLSTYYVRHRDMAMNIMCPVEWTGVENWWSTSKHKHTYLKLALEYSDTGSAPSEYFCIHTFPHPLIHPFIFLKCSLFSWL